MVRPLPSNVAANRLGSDPMGSQPAPPFQYASPASGPPLPFVSKSRSAASSYPVQPSTAAQPSRSTASANVARYAAPWPGAGVPSPSRS